MAPSREFRILPATSRRHGLPPIGFSLCAPDSVQVSLLDPSEGKALLRGTEVDASGRIVGQAEIDVFTAALIIDPDRVLARIVEAAAEALVAAPCAGEAGRTHAIELADGTRGFRVEVAISKGRTGAKPLLPYVSLIALAPPDPATRGGILLTMRSAGLTWEPAESILESLRLLTRGGANDNLAGIPPLPIVKR